MFIKTKNSETIIKHIISPVELEKDIIKDEYNSLQEEYADDFKKVKFEEEIKTGLSSCQSFIE